MDVRGLRLGMYWFSVLGFIFIVIAFVSIFLQELVHLLFSILVIVSMLMATGSWIVASKFKVKYKHIIRKRVEAIIANGNYNKK